jgi:hypothetical protein
MGVIKVLAVATQARRRAGIDRAIASGGQRALLCHLSRPNGRVTRECRDVRRQITETDDEPSA